MREEVRAKISATMKAKWHDPEFRAKQSITQSTALKELWQEPKYRVMMSIAHQAQNPEYKAKIKATLKALWQDSEYVSMQMKARSIKPNKTELALQGFLDKYFPGIWKYVGDGQVNIGGCLPDFININGKKEVIELFAAHWHPIFDIAIKKEHYRQYGFRLAIIWQDELKDESRLLKVLGKKFKGYI